MSHLAIEVSIFNGIVDIIVGGALRLISTNVLKNDYFLTANMDGEINNIFKINPDQSFKDYMVLFVK